MTFYSRAWKAILAASTATTTIVSFAAHAPAAESIIEQWGQVKPPAPPEVKSVTVDGATTALLVLDFNGAQDPAKGPCSTTRGGRCIATIPAVKGLLERARDKAVFVVYSIGPTGTAKDIAIDLAPKGSDPVVQSTANKFVGTDLGKILASKAIKTLIIVGTVSEGAVLATGTDAVYRGFNVIVPVDGMSSAELYPEQYVAWHFTHAPVVSTKVTLSRSDLIKF